MYKVFCCEGQDSGSEARNESSAVIACLSISLQGFARPSPLTITLHQPVARGPSAVWAGFVFSSSSEGRNRGPGPWAPGEAEPLLPSLARLGSDLRAPACPQGPAPGGWPDEVAQRLERRPVGSCGLPTCPAAHLYHLALIRGSVLSPGAAPYATRRPVKGAETGGDRARAPATGCKRCSESGRCSWRTPEGEVPQHLSHLLDGATTTERRSSRHPIAQRSPIITRFSVSSPPPYCTGREALQLT